MGEYFVKVCCFLNVSFFFGCVGIVVKIVVGVVLVDVLDMIKIWFF